MAVEEQTELKDVLAIIFFLGFMMLSIFLFAGYIVWAHEATAQTCINNGLVWMQENCILPKN